MFARPAIAPPLGIGALVLDVHASPLHQEVIDGPGVGPPHGPGIAGPDPMLSCYAPHPRAGGGASTPSGAPR